MPERELRMNKIGYSVLFEELFGFYAGREIGVPLVPPEHVYFSLTNRCNLKCRMCSVSGGGDCEMGTGEVCAIIRQVKDLGVRHLILSGGEALLRRDLKEIVSFSVSCGIEMVDVITNGTLLNEETADFFVKEGLNHLTVSLDGLRKNNDHIRGEGVFDRVEAAMDILNRVKKTRGRRNPTLGINFTVMDRNVEDMLPMLDFARGKECNIVVFQPVLFDNVKMHVKQKSPLWPCGDKLRLLEGNLKRLQELKRDPGHSPMIYTSGQVLSSMPAYFRGRMPAGRIGCYEGIKRMVITSGGQVWSCLGVYGDARREKLADIWVSAPARRVRKKARRCRRHCLQDCVYFPSSVAEEALKVVAGAPDEEKGLAASSLEAVLEKTGTALAAADAGFLGKIRGRNALGSLKAEIRSAGVMRESAGGREDRVCR